MDGFQRFVSSPLPTIQDYRGWLDHCVARGDLNAKAMLAFMETLTEPVTPDGSTILSRVLQTISRSLVYKYPGGMFDSVVAGAEVVMGAKLLAIIDQLQGIRDTNEETVREGRAEEEDEDPEKEAIGDDDKGPCEEKEQDDDDDPALEKFDTSWADSLIIIDDTTSLSSWKDRIGFIRHYLTLLVTI
jgi:hypothetical protein